VSNGLELPFAQKMAEGLILLLIKIINTNDENHSEK
jgi:hypothetical protein